MATDEEVELLAPVSTTVSLEEDISGEEDIGLAMVELAVSVLEEGINSIVEESLPRESKPRGCPYC